MNFKLMLDAYADITLHRPKSLPPIYEKGSGWYKAWYFNLRLVEEFSRSTRYHLPLSAISIFLLKPLAAAGEKAGLSKRLAELATAGLREADIPAVMGEQELAVLLPHTTLSDAQTVCERLVQALKAYHPVIGAACYPDTALDSSRLLLSAKHRALASVTDRERRQIEEGHPKKKGYRTA